MTKKSAPRPVHRLPLREADRRAELIARVQRAARQRRRTRILARRAG